MSTKKKPEKKTRIVPVSIAPVEVLHLEPTDEVTPPPSPVINNLLPDTLTESEKQYGLELQAKFPEVVAAAADFANLEQTAARKYFTLADSLRRTGLNGRELGILLASLGYRKQRVTEIKKAISVSDDVWNKYKANVIGFKAVLAIARAPAETPPAETPPAETPPAETPPAETPPAGGRITKVFPVPADIMETIADILSVAVDAGHFTPLVSGGYYQMEYGVYLPVVEGQPRKVRKFLVSFEPSESEVK